MKWVLTLLLICAFVAIYLLFGHSEQQKQAVSDLQIASTQDNANAKQLGSMNSYEVIVKRPLFIEQREFDKEQPVKKVRRVKPVIEDLKVKALGIALTGEGILAVLKDLKNGNSVRLRIGEKIYGWRLDAVSETSFTFSKSGKEKVVVFKE